MTYLTTAFGADSMTVLCNPAETEAGGFYCVISYYYVEQLYTQEAVVL